MHNNNAGTHISCQVRKYMTLMCLICEFSQMIFNLYFSGIINQRSEIRYMYKYVFVQLLD